MQITVNADDFGISREVNKAICEAFEKGLINRTTLMVNMPFANEAMQLAKEQGFSDKVGLHLNLTAGFPLSEELSKDPVMCNKQGEFSADFARSLKTRFFLPKKTDRLIEKEIRLQLDKYKELGGCLWHMDSHHHVHTDPSIWRIIRRILKSSDNPYPVSSIRLSRNMYKGGSFPANAYKSLYNNSVRKLADSGCNYFGSAKDFENFFENQAGSNSSGSADNINNNCTNNMNNGKQRLCIEIMVHPMYSDTGELIDTDMPLKSYLDFADTIPT